MTVFNSRLLPLSLLVFSTLFISAAVDAQLPVLENPNHEAMLASDNPQLASNKRIVYDMWRVLLEAGQTDQAEKFLTKDYTDHNPIVPPGREAFVEYLKQRSKKEIEDRVKSKIVSITAERDRVIIGFVRELENPKPENKGEIYTTSGFDMYRIENGLVAEHWDAIELGRTTPHMQ